MVESEFVLLGTDRDAHCIPWALLASDRDGALEFAGPAILNPPQRERGSWGELMAALAVAKPPLRGLRQGSGYANNLHGRQQCGVWGKQWHQWSNGNDLALFRVDHISRLPGVAEGDRLSRRNTSAEPL
jgi:hypothetical protein